MKKLLLSLAIFAGIGQLAKAQDKVYTKAGHISFYSKATMEDIEAHNKRVTAIVNTKTGQIEFAVLMKGFEFKKALMEEHFNENYVESDKFPKSTFKGQIDNAKDINFAKDGTYPATVSGTLTMHGESKPVTAKGTFVVQGGKISAKSEFKVLLSDYKIAIPAMVKDKVAETITIKVDLNLEPYTK